MNILLFFPSNLVYLISSIPDLPSYTYIIRFCFSDTNIVSSEIVMLNKFYEDLRTACPCRLFYFFPTSDGLWCATASSR